jgi:bisphosphoglycerate-independent phosphoglycerate mutase (AlkP superfamily)
MAVNAAKLLKDVWSLPEGPEVEVALYKVTTHEPSSETIFSAKNWKEVLAPFHTIGIDDQFMPPLVRVDEENKPVGNVRDGDIVFYWDFRTDRAKPLTSAFLGIPFEGQVGGLSEQASATRPNITFCTMTHYDDRYSACSCAHEAFNPAAPLSNTYAEVVGALGVKQLVVAESEKWRAVTWYAFHTLTPRAFPVNALLVAWRMLTL